MNEIIMKSKAIYTGILLSVVLVVNSTAQKSDFPVLKGPYLGQKPPGMIPEIFAPGFISTEKSELNSVFSPDGNEFYYSIYTPEPVGAYTIWYTKMIDKVWTKPDIVPFSGEFTDVDMSFSPDEKRLYFCSRRPVPGNPKPEYYVWYCSLLEDHSWSEPVLLDFPVNTPFSETYPTFTKEGRMYLASNRNGSTGSKDVYSIDYVGERFTNQVNLGDSINTEYGEGDTFIASDESYMIISCWGRPEGEGMDISFKKMDGSWTKKVNIEKTLNWNTGGGCPYVSPDGKYFFFTNNGDIYWVSAKIIDQLRKQ
jgi:Tol biopolymer transport system component